MKRLPVGIQNFREIIEDNHVYVDKTMYVHQLLNEGKYYFLSRPRRFGKSLLLDTIAEAFKGNKDLFKGLWISKTDYDFKPYPVIRLDMSNISSETPEIFKESVVIWLQMLAMQENINFINKTPSGLFSELITGLYKKYNQRVVVLVDEYDKPILDRIEEIETADANRMIIRELYGIIKPLDSYIKFAFFTGITKFTKTSVFSSLNNITDITMNKKYANICGIPVDDLEHYFGDYIKDLAADDRFKAYPDMRDLILKWYDGYSWDAKTKLLNPYGLLSFFFAGEFKGFWYASGSPIFLVKLIKNNPRTLPEINDLKITEEALDVIDIKNLEIASLLFQTGYLTVAKVIYPGFEVSPEYVLKIPNLEVRAAFFKQLTAGLTDQEHIYTDNLYRQFNKALKIGDLQSILVILRSLFAAIPNQLHVGAEAYYHSIFFSVMNVLGFKIDAEVSVSRGRIDAALEYDDKIYIFEFKYVSCPPDVSESEKRVIVEKALKQGMKQIADKGYTEKYKSSGKTIYQAAFAFLGRDNVEMESLIYP